MFIGHFAVAFAGKKAAPRAPLAALLLAALFADVLWPVLVAVGAEHVQIVMGATVYTPLEFVSYPWSHSLLMLVIWGGFVAAYFRGRVDGGRTGFVLFLLVVSHWVLDWVTHKPDMPLYPRGPEYGLGLWNSVSNTVFLETVMFAAGVGVYANATRAKNRIGSIGLWSLVLLLFGFYLYDSFDPAPPPSVRAIWISALVATAVMLGWAALIDRNRAPLS